MKSNGMIKTKYRIRNLPIQRKLIFSFLILIIFPAILIGSLSFYRSSELLKEKTEQYSSDILLETSDNIEAKLRDAERLSFQILSNVFIHDALKISNSGFSNEEHRIASERVIDSQLRSLISSVPGVAAIQVISDSNISYLINQASLPLSSLQMGNERKQILEEANGAVCWFDTDAASQTVVVGRVINSHVNQKKIGYTLIYLRESGIFSTFSETQLFRYAELYVVNRQGMIISCRDKSLLGQQNKYTSQKIMNAILSKSIITAKIEEKVFYVTSQSIEQTPWRILSFISAAEYEKEITRLKNWIILIILMTCLLSLAFSIGISSSISKPVRNLSNMMLKVGDGDFNVHSDYESKDEIGVLSHHFNQMVEQVKQLIRKAYQEELLKQKAELKSLRMQINPHFLYNSLESINWMARIRGVPEIGKMVKALGDLMRASIGGNDFVTVGEEIQNIKNYLTIQKFRYGDKVDVKINIDSSISPYEIPKLILQPIVENAIVHGIENKVGNGAIFITGKIEEGRILLQVEDDGMGMDEDRIARFLSDKPFPQQEGHTHIGLKNVDRRLRMYYGEENGVKISSHAGSGTIVSITIPIGDPVSF